jgi:hypothetical protein
MLLECFAVIEGFRVEKGVSDGKIQAGEVS